MPPWNTVRPVTVICATCGKAFLAKRPTALRCSGACRNRSRSPRPYDADRAKVWRLARLARPGYRESVNAVANARATAIRRWLDELKVAAGCVDCGYNANAVALDFDHVGDAKTRNVCNSKSIGQARAEIAHCEVRCSNCHRIKTHERRQHQSTADS